MSEKILSVQTKKIYDREIARIESMNISLTKIKSIPNFFKVLLKKYKASNIPYENFRLAIFAIRNHFISNGRKLSKAMISYLKKDNIDALRAQYIEGAGATPEQAEPSDVTNVIWNVIVQRTRPYIEDTSNDPYDRLLLALYTFIPPRRSDYWNLDWATSNNESKNTLSENGTLTLADYKTKRTYGPYVVELYQEGTFHGDPEAALFRQIIDVIPLEQKTGRVFKTRSGSGYSMVSFASKVKSLFSSVCQLNVSIIDLRRSFDQWCRAKLSAPNLSMEMRGNLYKAIEMATAHSRAMSDYYADRVEVA